MHPCERCGGLVQTNLPNCPYCGALTPFGAQAQSAAALTSHARAQHEMAQARTRDAQALTALRRTAWWSVVASSLGLVTCCLPLASVVGIALGLRAGYVARRHRLTFPAAGVLGTLLGLVGLVTAVGFWIFFGVDQYYEEQHKGELRAQIGDGDRAAVLAQPTACVMAELELLETNYQSHTRSDQVRCHGKLVVAGEAAVLRDLRVLGTGRQHSAFVCFKRGAKWMVTEIREDALCGSPRKDAGATASASGAPAPAGSTDP